VFGHSVVFVSSSASERSPGANLSQSSAVNAIIKEAIRVVLVNRRHSFLILPAAITSVYTVYCFCVVLFAVLRDTYKLEACGQKDICHRVFRNVETADGFHGFRQNVRNLIGKVTTQS